jgi:hypothetical protein
VFCQKLSEYIGDVVKIVYKEIAKENKNGILVLQLWSLKNTQQCA